MRNRPNFMAQFFSFFALVRVQNILLLTLAFFLTAKYFFAPQKHFIVLLTDYKFWALLSATALSIAAGYIINAFYDVKKDLINRPEKTLLEQQLSQRNRLYLYFSLNFLAVIFAGFISWRAAVFFSVYIFLIWLYSHKIQNLPFINNLGLTILSIFPFFAIFLYFKTFNGFIFWHATFLFLILLIKNLVKDFVKLKGDMVEGKQTIPIIYGERKAKNLILLVSLLTLMPIYKLLHYDYIGDMKYYFYFSMLIYAIGFLFFYFKKRYYIQFYIWVKVLLALGVFAIILIGV